ncbi:MAG TPA: hypothetical protein VFE69_14490, partial [Ilumatobacteraceae bacterium]|nr:hypothetical protein [Ilumatobacteraceae bacterium]
AVRDTATLAALVVASTLAILGRSTPYDIGTVAAGVIGIATGLVISRAARTDAPHARNAEP